MPKKEKNPPILPLGSTTLRVYLELVKCRKPLGVREVQRRLGFRSPNTAKYHLDRLEAMGLVEKVLEGYKAKRDESTILSVYTTFLGFLLPKILPYTIALTAGLIAYIVLSWPIIDYTLLILFTAALTIMWYEGLSLYRLLRLILRKHR